MNRRMFVRAVAAAPFVLRALPAAAGRAAPVALVTCDDEARLAVVDLDRLRVVDSIPTVADPRSVERVGDVALVCHTAVGALSIVDRRGVRGVVHGVEEPRYAAAHPDGRHAFVTDSGRSGIVVVDVVRGHVLGRVALPGWARHITISHDGSRVWAGLGTASEHVAVVDTRSLRRASFLTPGFLAHDVGRGADGRLWVTSGAERELAAGGRRLAADRAPQHVTFGAGRVYVTSGDDGTLQVLLPDGRLVSRTEVVRGSYNVQYGARRVVTPSLTHGTLTVLAADGTSLGVVRVAGSCHDACIFA